MQKSLAFFLSIWYNYFRKLELYLLPDLVLVGSKQADDLAYFLNMI